VRFSPAPIVEMARVYDAWTRILGRRATALTPDAIAATVPQVAWKALSEWESKSDAASPSRSGSPTWLWRDRCSS
jgi:hypothetical protein